MKKLSWNIYGAFLIGGCLVLSAPLAAFGQSKVEDDPFEFAVQSVEMAAKPPQAGATAEKIGASVGQSGRNQPRKSARLKYNKTLDDSPDQAGNYLDIITRKYGPPTSLRGDNHVWDIANTNNQPDQARLVTIMVTYQPAGISGLVIDRRRGEDGSETYALARAKKERDEKNKQNPNPSRPPPIIVPNND